MADKLKLLRDEIESAEEWLNQLQDEHIRLTGQRYKPPIRLTPKYEKEAGKYYGPVWARRAK